MVGGVVAIVFIRFFRDEIGRLIDRMKKIGVAEFGQQSQAEFGPKELDQQVESLGQLGLNSTDPASLPLASRVHMSAGEEIKSLIEMKEIATHRLLNNWPLAPDDPDGKRKWIAKIKAWEAATDKLLQKAGATEGQLSDFRTVVSFSPVGPAVDKEHADWKGMLAARLHTLAQIIRDLETRRSVFIKLGKAAQRERDGN